MQELHEKGLILDYEQNVANGSILLCFEKAPCFLLMDDDKIVGFYGLMETHGYCSMKPILQDYMFYILPAYRKLANILLICSAAREYAKAVNLPLYLNYQIFRHIKSHKRLMEQAGFEVTGLRGVYHG